MFKPIQLLASFLLLPILLVACKEEDRIKNLPGLTFKPDFEHFSGYLKVSPEHQLFYWLVTSQSNASTDPLIFWFNGGPGCSSVLGLLSEHGPYLVDRAGEKLVKNPNSWNRRANVVYLESPAGVGFSIPGDDKEWNDEITSLDNYEAIKQFFKKFPEFRQNDFFIAGESYAGVYVPILAERIIDGKEKYHINFKGMAIGNGDLNETMSWDTSVRYAYAHGMIDEHKWQSIKSETCGGSIDGCDLSEIGQDYYVKMRDKLNLYDIYEKCESKKPAKYSFKQLPHHHPSLVCDGDDEYGYSTYLNRQEVQEALHVAGKKHWEMCSFINMVYQRTDGVELKVKKALNAGVRVLLYYGDTDIVCNLMLGSKFAASLGYELEKPAAPWFYNHQVAGFETIYNGGLTYLTVRGAGHMVPQKKGPEILHAIEAFMDNIEISEQIDVLH